MEQIKLSNLDVARLHNAELSSLMERFFDDFSKKTLSLDTDAIFKTAYEEMKSQLAVYNTGLDQVRTNEDSNKVAKADALRGADFKALKNSVKPFRTSLQSAESEAYTALNILLSEYKGVENDSYEVQTTRLTNLVERLQSSAYTKHINELGIRRFVTRLAESNVAFKEIFSKRSFDMLQKTTYDVKKLRKELTESYRKLSNYVLSLAQMTKQPFYIETLDVLNNGRKYFADTILARRSGKKEAKK
ncbi:MAG: DUF6261 family protein [Capnocytophaga sp.]|nr:DUF6261 family protein [Capnocytophaga sp.]